MLHLDNNRAAYNSISLVFPSIPVGAFVASSQGLQLKYELTPVITGAFSGFSFQFTLRSLFGSCFRYVFSLKLIALPCFSLVCTSNLAAIRFHAKRCTDEFIVFAGQLEFGRLPCRSFCKQFTVFSLQQNEDYLEWSAVLLRYLPAMFSISMSSLQLYMNLRDLPMHSFVLVVSLFWAASLATVSAANLNSRSLLAPLWNEIINYLVCIFRYPSHAVPKHSIYFAGLQLHMNRKGVPMQSLVLMLNWDSTLSLARVSAVRVSRSRFMASWNQNREMRDNRHVLLRVRFYPLQLEENRWNVHSIVVFTSFSLLCAVFSASNSSMSTSCWVLIDSSSVTFWTTSFSSSRWVTIVSDRERDVTDRLTSLLFVFIRLSFEIRDLLF